MINDDLTVRLLVFTGRRRAQITQRNADLFSFKTINDLRLRVQNFHQPLARLEFDTLAGRYGGRNACTRVTPHAAGLLPAAKLTEVLQANGIAFPQLFVKDVAQGVEVLLRFFTSNSQPVGKGL